MVNSLNDRVVGTKVRILVILASLAIVGVIVFQVSWLINSYRVSKQQAKADLNDVLDESFILYQQAKADSARSLIRHFVKSENDFHYEIFEWPGNPQIAYKDARNSYVMYPIKALEIPIAKRNPYAFLMLKINILPLDGLRQLYGPLVSYRSYPNGSEESRNYRKLVDLFSEVYNDTTALNGVIRKVLARKRMNISVSTQFFNDIKKIYTDQTPEAHNSDRTSRLKPSTGRNKGKMTEVVMRTESISEKLKQLQQYIEKLNSSNDRLFIAKPVMYDMNDMRMDHIPLLVFSAKIPDTYILQKMLYTITGTFTLLLFISFCLVYMLYLIVRQKKFSEIKNDFISNMSHELKTPIATTLAAVQGMQYFDILKDDKKTAEYLATASEELKRLSVMVTKILNSTVFESSEFVINPIVFNLKEAIEEVINAHHLLGHGNVSIILDYNISNKVFADRTHLQQAIANLIDNAIKYSDKQSIILVECKPVDSGAEISIKDNGPGIAKEYHKQIFDRFFRIPASNSRRVNGYGLGLNYVKAIVEKHDGSITLKKSDCSGSTFIIFLPQ